MTSLVRRTLTGVSSPLRKTERLTVEKELRQSLQSAISCTHLVRLPLRRLSMLSMLLWNLKQTQTDCEETVQPGDSPWPEHLQRTLQHETHAAA